MTACTAREAAAGDRRADEPHLPVRRTCPRRARRRTRRRASSLEPDVHDAAPLAEHAADRGDRSAASPRRASRRGVRTRRRPGRGSLTLALGSEARRARCRQGRTRSPSTQAGACRARAPRSPPRSARSPTKHRYPDGWRLNGGSATTNANEAERDARRARSSRGRTPLSGRVRRTPSRSRRPRRLRGSRPACRSFRRACQM